LGLAIGWQGPHLLAQRANLPFIFVFANARLAITVSCCHEFHFRLASCSARRQRQPDCCAQIRVIFSFLF
jgi:hypothetical protein